MPKSIRCGLAAGISVIATLLMTTHASAQAVDACAQLEYIVGRIGYGLQGLGTGPVRELGGGHDVRTQDGSAPLAPFARCTLFMSERPHYSCSMNARSPEHGRDIYNDLDRRIRTCLREGGFETRHSADSFTKTYHLSGVRTPSLSGAGYGGDIRLSYDFYPGSRGSHTRVGISFSSFEVGRRTYTDDGVY